MVAFSPELTSAFTQHYAIQQYFPNTFSQDFNILLFQRPLSASVYSKKIVFPGGVLSEADTMREHWSEIFDQHVVADSGATPQIYNDFLDQRSSTVGKDELLPPFVSFRLCALRELFEETGLLLVEEPGRHHAFHTAALIMGLTDLHYWHMRVMKQPEMFARLYSHVDRKPPLNALKLWSNWLTPISRDSRFDTVFYFVQIQSAVSASHANPSWAVKWSSAEVTEMYADKPAAFLAKQTHSSSNLYVPPQLYELGRLAQFKSLAELASFAERRAPQGCRRWLPIELRMEGSVRVFVFPGDQRYTEPGDSVTAINEAELKADKQRNRLVAEPNSEHFWIDCNVCEFGHVAPISRAEFAAKYTSV